MKVGTVHFAILLCFIVEKSLSVRVFIVDIPDKDVNAITDQDYVYYDYEQIIPTQVVKTPIQKQVEKLSYTEKEEKFCERFGSMYGIDESKYKCKMLLRMNDQVIKQENNANGGNREKKSTEGYKATDKIGHNFAQDYVDDFWRSKRFKKNTPDLNTLPELGKDKKATQREQKLSQSGKTEHHFSQDYVDDFWRSTGYNNGPPTCTLTDIINNKCKFSLNAPNQFKSKRFTDSKFDEDKEKKTKVDKIKHHFSPSHFSQDYVDDFWRSSSPNNDHPECTLSDIFNNKCKVNLVSPNRMKLNQFSASKLYKAKKAKQIKDNSVLTDKTQDDLAIALFAQDYIDDLWSASLKTGPPCTLSDIVNNKCELNADTVNELKSKLLSESKSDGKKPESIDNEAGLDAHSNFAQDYVDEFWRTKSLKEELVKKLCEAGSDDPICVARKSNLIQFKPNQFRNGFRSSRHSDTDDSDEVSASEEKPITRKPKRFQIVRNKKRKTKKKSKKSKKVSSDSDADESKKSSDESAEAKVVKPSQDNIKTEQSDFENDLTDIDGIDTSDSFETGPKKAADKYQYLQAHRYVKPKAVNSKRRASRLQTFLPKRYNWKPEDIHNLGYFWFEGPKGSFPSDNL